MCSPLNGFLLIFHLKATRDSQRFRFWVWGVQLDSPVWCAPRSLTPRWDAHRGAWLGSIMHTAELDSTVWCTPQSLTPQCDAQCTPRSFWEIRVTWLWGVMHTLELDSPKSDYYENVRFWFFRIRDVFQLRFYQKTSLDNLWLSV